MNGVRIINQNMTGYSQLVEAQRIFSSLLQDQNLPVPDEFKSLAQDVSFYNNSDSLVLPCRLKECEMAAALKGLEATAAVAIANLRYGVNDNAKIDLQHALMFLFLTYLASVDGMTKLDKNVVSRLKQTDINEAQSITYRRMSANLYKTKDERYYHIHGSLEASTTLNMIGLPAYEPELTEYEDVIKVIQGAVSKLDCDDLEALNTRNRQAGIEALTEEQFLETKHGKVILKEPYWTIESMEQETPPVAFACSTGTDKPKILQGIKILELCRIIAGPTIGRILAEYGAEVIKVTSPNLPDVPFFQVDVNVGKHTTSLNLKNEQDREIFEALLRDADVILDGYRTNAIERLGYGPSKIAEMAKSRKKGYIYGSENCFGFNGQWADRAGWQQIADCASGVAWIHGKSLGLDEPLIPPFPMSDYGTGCMVAIAVLTAIYKRARYGGSYWCKSSLVQYDLLLLKQGLYPDDLWKESLTQHDKEIFDLRYCDSVDKISSTCLRSMKRIKPELFDDTVSEKKYMEEMDAPAFKGKIKVLKPVVEYSSTSVGFDCPSRPNGYDKPEWWK